MCVVLLLKKLNLCSLCVVAGVAENTKKWGGSQLCLWVMCVYLDILFSACHIRVNRIPKGLIIAVAGSHQYFNSTVSYSQCARLDRTRQVGDLTIGQTGL